MKGSAKPLSKKNVFGLIATFCIKTEITPGHADALEVVRARFAFGDHLIHLLDPAEELAGVACIVAGHQRSPVR
jgi:hypothetical protein